MRTAWLVPLLLITLPPACSDDDGGDGNAGGSGGGNAAGAAGSGAAGAGGAAGAASAGSGGAGGSAGSTSAAGSAGSSSAGGSAGVSGSGGAGGSSASGATGCDGLCARPVVCPGTSRAECLSECEDGVELCPNQSEALLRCAETLSDSDFQCVGDLTIPKDDLCVTESAAFARCRIGF